MSICFVDTAKSAPLLIWSLFVFVVLLKCCPFRLDPIINHCQDKEKNLNLENAIRKFYFFSKQVPNFWQRSLLVNRRPSPLSNSSKYITKNIRPNFLPCSDLPCSNDLQSNRNLLNIWKNTTYKLTWSDPTRPDFFQKVKLTRCLALYFEHNETRCLHITVIGQEWYQTK
jgi:hypothetical protein